MYCHLVRYSSFAILRPHFYHISKASSAERYVLSSSLSPRLSALATCLCFEEGKMTGTAVSVKQEQYLGAAYNVTHDRQSIPTVVSAIQGWGKLH